MIQYLDDTDLVDVEVLSIKQTLLIPRTSGKVNLATIRRLDGNKKTIHVEWYENNVKRTKIVKLEPLKILNPKLFPAPNTDYSARRERNRAIALVFG